MAEKSAGTKRIPCYCALCVSRCGATAVVENGRFVALEPNPSHPTGKALCAKGRAAPELVYHPDRLRYPLRRTRPKGAPDPGWERISWEEALGEAAARLKQIAAVHGPESVAFSIVSPSTSASVDSTDWIQRLAYAFGSPNLCVSMELCGWGRYLATSYTFGDGVPGSFMPDLENAGCILFWGYNPNLARLAHGTAMVQATKRGAKLIVVDPRRTGPARRADLWLQVRPGTDGALALSIAHVMITRGWFDAAFVRRWTNGPLLVRDDSGRLLTEQDLDPGGDREKRIAWLKDSGSLIVYNPASGLYDGDPMAAALTGSVEVQTAAGPVLCRPVFDLLAAVCAQYPPAEAEKICRVPAGQIEEAARLVWAVRPLAYYAWSGVEMQTNATQIARAIAQLCVLTGSLDVRGGNVLFPAVPSNPVAGQELMSPEQRGQGLGVSDRPLGPARFMFTTTGELYRGILDQQPYGVHGMVGFGANLLLSHADGRLGRQALQVLDFYIHADLFMNPTAEQADIVLPVAGAFEREGLKIGFDISHEAQELVQLRPAVADPPGEARSDNRIVFDLAVHLGLGQQFWGGDVDAAYRHQLEPSGLTLETLRQNPAGVRVPLKPAYQKFAEMTEGTPVGFKTPSKTIELFSETMQAHGYQPLPDYQEPLVSPLSRPDLVEKYPLILTCAKHNLFCESQHRALPSLRKQAPDPEVEIHPETAASRGIQAGDWVRIATPTASVKALARFNPTLQPDVICGQHGWWQACSEIGAEGYDPFGAEGANFNLLINREAIDPVSGSVPHRAFLCQVFPVK